MRYGNPKHIEVFKQVIKNYQWESEKGYDNAKMKKVIASDRKQFRKILSLYRKGDWDTALKEAWHMDTAARYYIPDVIWNEINQD